MKVYGEYRNKNLSINEYLDKIKSFFKNIVTDLQKSGTLFN